jgi:hypothetical protein
MAPSSLQSNFAKLGQLSIALEVMFQVTNEPLGA